MALRTLNARHHKVIEGIVSHGDGERAAREAGFAVKWAKNYASNLKTDPLFAEALRARQAEVAKKLKMDTDEWLREVALIARFDITNFVYKPETNEHALKDGVHPSVWRTVKAITYHGKTGRQMLTPWSKTEALQMLGKNLNLTPERVEHTGEGGGPIETRDVTLTVDERANRVRTLFEHAQQRAAASN